MRIVRLFFFLASLAALAQNAPTYKVDPFWPKQLPNDWIIGQIGGLTVDRQNHIWVLQRPGSDTPDELGAAQKPPRSQCCFVAPPVLEFDQQGNLLQSWGGPGKGYDWPGNEHGIRVDNEGNVWIGANGPKDRQVLKFTGDGRFLLQIGHPDAAPAHADSHSHTNLHGAAGIDVDDAAHEVYISDGYRNKRIVVFDSQTGAFKRMWGAYGNPPIDVDPGPYSPSAHVDQQFRNPVHCVHLSNDGLVYVCDRVNDRIQVFTKEGKFLKEFLLRKETLGAGSVWELAFSRDRDQKFLLIADGENNVIWTLLRSITGRNHHAVGFGMISEATGYPGYDSVIGPQNATIGRILSAPVAFFPPATRTFPLVSRDRRVPFACRRHAPSGGEGAASANQTARSGGRAGCSAGR